MFLGKCAHNGLFHSSSTHYVVATRRQTAKKVQKNASGYQGVHHFVWRILHGGRHAVGGARHLHGGRRVFWEPSPNFPITDGTRGSVPLSSSGTDGGCELATITGSPRNTDVSWTLPASWEAGGTFSDKVTGAVLGSECVDAKVDGSLPQKLAILVFSSTVGKWGRRIGFRDMHSRSITWRIGA